MNGCDFVKWRGKTQRIRGSIIKKRQVVATIGLIWQTSREQRTQHAAKKWPKKKRKDKLNRRQTATDRQ